MIRETVSRIPQILRRKFSFMLPLPLKYQGAAVVFQEVPDEISLAINISGCPRNCEGCHSPHLREYMGYFLRDNIDALIMENSGITCVCFMGGDQNLHELRKIVRRIRKKWPRLKIALYTGADDEDSLIEIGEKIKPDYLKFGPYRENRGPLNKPGTNQRFLKIKYPYGYNSPLEYTMMEDLTHLFQIKELGK